MKINKKKIWVSLLITVILCLLAIPASFYFLPSYISSAHFRKIIENQVKQTFINPVVIGNITWTWSEGILLENIVIKNAPTYTDPDFIKLKKVHLQIYLSDILKKKIHFDFTLDGLTVNAERSIDDKMNIEGLVKQKPGPEQVEEADTARSDGAISLPVDVQTKITLKNVSMHYNDRITEKNISLENIRINLNMVSLLNKPVSLAMDTDLVIDKNEPSPQSLNVRIEKIFNSKKELSITDTMIYMKGVLPGINISAEGNIYKKGIKNNIQIAISPLTEFLSPFLPEELSTLKAGGTLNFKLHISGDPSEKIIFDSIFTGNDLAFSGGPVSSGEIGPAHFSIIHKGSYHAHKKHLELNEGQIRLLDKSSIQYKISINDLDKKDPFIDFNVGPLVIDFRELYDQVESAVTDDMLNNTKIFFKKCQLQLTSLVFTGNPGGHSDLLVKNMSFQLPETEIQQNGQTIHLLGLTFRVPRFSAILENSFPKNAELLTDLSIDSLMFRDDTNRIFIEGMSIPEISVQANHLKPVKSSQIGLSGKINISEKLIIKNFRLPETAIVENVEQSLFAGINIFENESIAINLDHLTASFPKISLKMPDKGNLVTNLRFTFAIPEISIPTLSPLTADIDLFTSSMNLDNIFRLDIQSRIKNMAKDLISTQGTARVNLSRLTETVMSRVDENIKLHGNLEFDWDIIAKLFSDAELNTLKSGSIDLKKDLAFLDKALFRLKIEDMGIDMTQPDTSKIEIKGISTSHPISYEFHGKDGSGRINGKAVIEEISQLPSAQLKKPVNAVISISGSHDGLETVTFTESLMLKPFNLSESLNISVSGIDKVITEINALTPSDLLNKLDAEMNFSIKPLGKLDFDVVPGIPLIDANLFADAHFKIIAGKEIGGDITLDIPRLDAAIENQFRINNLQSRIEIGKHYKIVNRHNTNQTINTPLSQKVLEVETDFSTAREGIITSAATGPFEKFTQSLQNQFKPKYALSTDACELYGTPLPVNITNIEADINFENGIPSLEYFRFDLFNGSVTGGFSVFKKTGQFYFIADISFSGIDTQKMFPGGILHGENSDTELSGKLSVLLPITPDIKTLIGEMELDVDFSHIGKRSLERILYALDPSESNESMVSQRKMLRKGTPKWIRIIIDDGALSVSGEVLVLDVTEPIPPVKRLNISNMTAILIYEEYLKDLIPAIEGLNILSSEAISFDNEGKILFIDTLTE